MPTATKLRLHDENAAGQRVGGGMTLDCLTETLSVRELIRARIYQEVRDFNQRQPEFFTGLVEPTNAERTLHGVRLRQPRPVDWEEQYERALRAFEGNGFFILVGDRQAEGLDERFRVTVDAEISFVKLTPLVGG